MANLARPHPGSGDLPALAGVLSTVEDWPVRTVAVAVVGPGGPLGTHGPTDRILPLRMEPKPRELVRVMVGRAELITPAMEWELMKQIVRFADPEERTRARAIEDARTLGLGRFLEPTTRRLMSKMPGREFSRVSWELLQAASKPAPEGRRLVGK